MKILRQRSASVLHSRDTELVCGKAAMMTHLDGQMQTMDCIFVVGHNEQLEEVRVCSEVLRLSSQRFLEIMRKKKMSHCKVPTYRHGVPKPHTFKAVIKFIHEGTLDGASDSPKDVVALARAALYYRLPALLQQMVSDRLLVTGNVWSVLDYVCQQSQLAPICARLLRTAPDECLQSESAMSAGINGVRFFFQQSTITVHRSGLLNFVSSRLKKKGSRKLKRFLRNILSNLKEDGQDDNVSDLPRLMQDCGARPITPLFSSAG